MDLAGDLLDRSERIGATARAVLFYKTPQRPSDILLTRTNLETLHDFRMELPRLRSCLRANGEALEDSVPMKRASSRSRVIAPTLSPSGLT